MISLRDSGGTVFPPYKLGILCIDRGVCGALLARVDLDCASSSLEGERGRTTVARLSGVSKSSFAQQYLDAWNEHDPKQVSAFFGLSDRSLYADSSRGVQISGKNIVPYISNVMTLGANVRYDLLDEGVMGGSRAAIRWQASGSDLHRICPLLPQGLTESIAGLDYMVIEQGKIVSSHVYFDLGPYLALNSVEPPRTGQYRKSGLSADEAERKAKLLARLMSEQKIFLDSEITVATVAQRLGVHPNHLSQIVNSQAGMNFWEFINGFRIEHAKRMIAAQSRDKKLSMTAIAFESGFGSVSAFYRIFGRHVAMTPLQYKQSVLDHG
ncbi:helix-turn-helix domain-containing protein [Pseudomonas sp. LABIM340]|uniref:helix-turn-helix domain-containing protein n=1 Tax=Pseudomonas sp. LABIM340 TaxID=3156585 RepID=UPI0032AF4D73